MRGWSSTASVTLWMDEAYPYVMLFTGDPLPDVARRSLAVEPMTCPPNAFRTGRDLIRLEPGRVGLEHLGNRPTRIVMRAPLPGGAGRA